MKMIGRLMLFRVVISVYAENHTENYTVDKAQSYLLLKQVVHAVNNDY